MYICTTPKRLKSGTGADYQENVPTNGVECNFDNLVYYEPKSVSTEEAASRSTSAKKRRNLSSSLPYDQSIPTGEAVSSSASPKVQKSIKSTKKPSALKPKMRIVYKVVSKRLRRRRLAKKHQIVDFTPKAKKVYEEALRLRKQLHKTKSRLKRYEI